MLEKIKEWRQHFKNHSWVNLLWFINLLPSLGGFSYKRRKTNVLFWILHIGLLFYVCIVGTVVYQMYHAEGIIDSINSFFNISIFVTTLNMTVWHLIYRNEFTAVLDSVMHNDNYIKNSGRFVEEYTIMLKKIKITISVCYVFHFVNEVCIYIPTRTLGMDNFSVVSCVGLDLTSTPSRLSCMAILAVQELTSIVAVCSYDVILIFLFSHTTAVYNVLHEEMKSIAKSIESGEFTEVSSRLRNLVHRHVSVLDTVKKLQIIYSVPIGIGFGLQAVSMCLFFTLPLDVCFNFGPLIYYSLLMFFLYCYQGQRLTTASEYFEESVYCCGWEHFKVAEQKCVLLMLIQAQKPVILLAAGVIPIRMYTFASTMQNIYKFVTIFKL